VMPDVALSGGLVPDIPWPLAGERTFVVVQPHMPRQVAHLGQGQGARQDKKGRGWITCHGPGVTGPGNMSGAGGEGGT